MEDKRGLAPEEKKTALSLFAHERPKNFIRNRFFAVVIDFVIVSLLCQVAFNTFGIPDWGSYFMMQDAVRGLPKLEPLVIERAALWMECFVFTLSIGAVYEAIMLVLFNATVGKLVFGLRVRVVRAGKKTSPFASKLLLVFRATIRAVSIYLLSGIPFIILCLATFGNADSRSGFDMFAMTKVVKKAQAVG